MHAEALPHSESFAKSPKSSASHLLSTGETGIHSLPNELLARIFFFVTRRNDIDFPKSGSALCMSVVCRRWRNLALSCSELWSNFSISLGGDPLDDYDWDESRRIAQETAVDIYLARSQPRLLTLDISIPHRWQEDRDHPILWKITQCAPRWQHISFRLLAFDCRVYPSLRELDLPGLESITITSSSGLWPVELNVLARATNLHTLEILGGKIEIDSDTPKHIFKKLTTLTFSLISMFGNLYEVLDLCPALLTLDISEWRSFPSPDPPYCLSQITSLSVSIDDHLMERRLPQVSVSSLTAPALVSLTLLQSGCISKEEVQALTKPFSAINSFLARSGCPLARLVIVGLNLTPQELVRLLKRLPSLEELTVKDPCISLHHNPLVTKTLLESLRIRTETLGTDGDDTPHSENSLESPYLVPKLHSLNLRVTSGENLDPHFFMDMVLSRWLPDETRASSLGVSCLRHVTLVLDHTVNDADFLALQSLSVQNRGLHVAVSRR